MQPSDNNNLLSSKVLWGIAIAGLLVIALINIMKPAPQPEEAAPVAQEEAAPVAKDADTSDDVTESGDSEDEDIDAPVDEEDAVEPEESSDADATEEKKEQPSQKEDDMLTTDYYQSLRKQCESRESENCCLASVEAMEAGKFKEATKDSVSCPSGSKRNMMRCIDSFAWCEPEKNTSDKAIEEEKKEEAPAEDVPAPVKPSERSL